MILKLCQKDRAVSLQYWHAYPARYLCQLCLQGTVSRVQQLIATLTLFIKYKHQQKVPNQVWWTKHGVNTVILICKSYIDCEYLFLGGGYTNLLICNAVFPSSFLKTGSNFKISFTKDQELNSFPSPLRLFFPRRKINEQR